MDRDIDAVGPLLKSAMPLDELIKPRREEFDAALDQLADAMRAGAVSAKGRTSFPLASDPKLAHSQARELNVLKEIEAGEWFTPHEFFVADDAINVRFFTPLYGYDRGYRHVIVAAPDVMKAWPKQSITQRSIASAEAKCKAWLAHEMRRSPTPPQPKNQYWKDAQQKFSGLSHAAFNRAWKQALADAEAWAWSRAGRPKKSSR
jgi:hypothetical protein